MSQWRDLANRILSGEEISRHDALQVVAAPDSETPLITEQATRIREHYWQDRVRLYMLLNAKSGLCAEDCGYCSQSRGSTAFISKYPIVSKDVILKAATQAHQLNVHTFCMVNSGRGPTEGELQRIGDAVRDVKKRFPLKVCTCLGLLKNGQAQFLKSCGVNTYNHNLNTSRDFYSKICSTHSYEDRVETVNHVKEAGIGTCSGGVVGMGESAEDVVNLAFSLKELQVDSIPVNFLHPIDGTPLANTNNLTPLKALRYLALFRFVNPQADLRIGGGRELHLQNFQPLGLRIANSIFIGDYLTTHGQPPEADYRMIRELGYTVET